MQDFFNWQGVIGTICGIIGMIVSIIVWIKSSKIENFLQKEKTRANESIKFILSDGKEEHEIVPSLRRREVSRSEIQGRLGTIPRKDENSPFYKIKYTNKREYYEQIDKIINGSNEQGDTKLVIECTQQEFEQFILDLPKIEAKPEAAVKVKTAKVKKLKNGK